MKALRRWVNSLSVFEVILLALMLLNWCALWAIYLNLHAWLREIYVK